MSKQDTYGDLVTSVTGSITTTAIALIAQPNVHGTVQYKLKNTGAATVYVGPGTPGQVAVDDTTSYFIGGDVAAAATFTLTNYNGPLAAVGATDSTYLFERIYYDAGGRT